MWMVVLGFGLTTLLLAWLLFGYIVWLRFVGDEREEVEGRKVEGPKSSDLRPSDLPTLPRISIVVPCLNEADLVSEKFRNLAECDYPADKLEIVFADGGSTDGTLDLLRALAKDDGHHGQLVSPCGVEPATRRSEHGRVARATRVIACPIGGKINQLNHVLPKLTGDIVVVTDADAHLAPDALGWMVAEFEARPEVAVVGAYTSPRGGLAVERCFWAAQNRVRLLESRISHVSLVVACCYAFRRSLLSAFPHDIIADDVYVAALANTLGYHTTYCKKALVEELRTPSTLPEFFRHKFRKSNAVLRELLRFSYCLPEIRTRWKCILATRIVQQLLLPWATALWLMFTATLANMGQADVPCLGAAVLLIALLATRKATMSVELPGEAERFGPVTIVLAYAYTMAVLCATALTYLSFRQSSCYPRLGDSKDNLCYPPGRDGVGPVFNRSKPGLETPYHTAAQTQVAAPAVHGVPARIANVE